MEAALSAETDFGAEAGCVQPSGVRIRRPASESKGRKRAKPDGNIGQLQCGSETADAVIFAESRRSFNRPTKRKGRALGSALSRLLDGAFSIHLHFRADLAREACEIVSHVVGNLVEEADS